MNCRPWPAPQPSDLPSDVSPETWVRATLGHFNTAVKGPLPPEGAGLLHRPRRRGRLQRKEARGERTPSHHRATSSRASSKACSTPRLTESTSVNVPRNHGSTINSPLSVPRVRLEQARLQLRDKSGIANIRLKANRNRNCHTALDSVACIHCTESSERQPHAGVNPRPPSSV